MADTVDFPFLNPCCTSDNNLLSDIHLCNLFHINLPGKGVNATGLKSEAVLGCETLGSGTIVLSFQVLGKVDFSNELLKIFVNLSMLSKNVCFKTIVFTFGIDVHIVHFIQQDVLVGLLSLMDRFVF